MKYRVDRSVHSKRTRLQYESAASSTGTAIPVSTRHRFEDRSESGIATPVNTRPSFRDVLDRCDSGTDIPVDARFRFEDKCETGTEMIVDAHPCVGTKCDTMIPAYATLRENCEFDGIDWRCRNISILNQKFSHAEQVSTVRL